MTPLLTHPDSYLVPAGPTNRLLLALLSPFRDEITWSLSRLIHASCLHPTHLLLSEWCGLAERLLGFVDRFNRAARGHPYHDAESSASAYHDPFADGDSDSDEEADETQQASSSRSFDPRCNEEDYFILNAAVSASLILRNASDIDVNAQWISKLHGIMRVAAEVIALPEDLFGFEGNLLREEGPDGVEATSRDEMEGDLRLEGVRELRLYWVEIAQTLAGRIRIYSRAPVVRFEDGTVQKVAADAVDVAAAAAAVAKAALEDDDEEEIADALTAPVTGLTRLHSSDRLFSHIVLLLHTTADRALLLACIRFLANLMATSKTKPDIFVERRVAPTAQASLEGLSPGIISRAKELLPLCDFDDQIADALLDCLDASVSIVVERPHPGSTHHQTPGEEGGEEEEDLRKEWPNVLKLVAANNRALASKVGGSSASSRRPMPLSQPVVALLVRLLSHKVTSWPRTHPMLPSPMMLSSMRYIPNVQMHAREAMAKDPTQVDAEARWRRLREMKAESGLVEYTTTSEKQKLKGLEEPKRVQEWLKLVTRVNTAPEAGAYITQMQIWTSYRDSFEPMIKASQQKAAQEGSAPLPPLMPAADVISAVTAFLTGTQAVLRPEEDQRIGGQKFVISGLDGFLRPEVRKHNCYWRGCPQPNVDTPEAQREHIRAHVSHAKSSDSPLRCHWGSCGYLLPEDLGANHDTQRQQKLMELHVRTHLPSEPKTIEHDEKQDTKPAQPPRFPPGQGRTVPLGEPKSSTATTDSYQNSHLHADGRQARSAPIPSKGTIDRPSQISFNVFRTPFDPVRGEPQGPAYAATHILATLARMCLTVLGDDDGADIDDDEGGHEKRVKLDFTDRKEELRFGMPFTLPKNFQATVPLALTSVQTQSGLLSAAEGQEGNPATSALLAASAAEATRQQAEAEAKAEASIAVQDLMSVEDELVRWAGCNDILTPTLLEALKNLSNTKGTRAHARKRPRRSSLALSAAGN